MPTDSRPTVAPPLSPHLQIYRVTWTMAMSVFHRGTGMALYGGAALLAIYLLALASGPKAFAWVAWLFGSWLGLLVLFGFTFALIHHMLGGLRHFIWDAGYGFERADRMRLAKYTLLASTALTLLIWAFALVLA